MGRNFKFQVQDSFFGLFFLWRLGDLKNESHFLKISHLYKVFCRNNVLIMIKMDKELTVPKWVLIVHPKIPQIPQKFQPKMSAQAPKNQELRWQ